MKICDADKCTGCGVCADVCPKNCISIKYDESGFYKSFVDESHCIKCNRCKNICTANHPNKSNRINTAYKARRTDKNAAQKSTSGGIASLLSEYIINSGGVVVGCGFDETLNLKHSIASRVDELEGFKGSKYLQSYTVGVYRQVKEQLSNNKPVMFIGTPCQVSALHNYLGKTYDNLYTVDFVCHGVPSRFVLDKYLYSLNKVFMPQTISYRNKTQGYRNKKACFEITVTYPDTIARNTTESGIYYWFASSLILRASCYKCPYASTIRSSDITLADYIGNDLNDEDDEIGVNTVFVNSDKGALLLKKIKHDMVTEQKSVVDMVKQYEHLISGSHKPVCRKAFFEELSACDYTDLVKKYDSKKVLPNKMIRRFYAMKRRISKFLLNKG